MKLNKRKYTILVSGASGIVGYGILRSLKGMDCLLIGTTIYERSPADCFSDFVEHSPLTHTPQYIPWLIDTINKYSVDMIIPGIEADMSVWNINRRVLEETGTKVLLNRSELISLCLDKWEFYQVLHKKGFKYCIETSISQDFHYFEQPFIIKPKCGYGSKGVVLISEEDEFANYKSRIGESLLMQEYVGSSEEEYTASAFFDKDSVLKAWIMMKRKLSQTGYTEASEIVFIDEVVDIMIELASILKPIGPTNFQFRKHKGQWKLLEINPRISSSTSIKSAFNYNECEMSIRYFLENKEVNQPEIRRGKAIRYIEDYIEYDSNNI